MPLAAPPPAPVRSAPTVTALVVRARPDETPAAFAARARHDLHASGRRAVLEFWFGRRVPGARIFGETAADAPALELEGRPCHAGECVGAQFYTVDAGVRVHRHRRDGRVVAVEFDDGRSVHLLGGGLAPADPTAAPATQAMSVLVQTHEFVRAAGFDYGDVARTWFFNRRILAWYDLFNRVRSALYRDVRFRAGATPASTGIEGTPHSGAALGFAWWAARPHDAGTQPAAPLASPLQCPAPAYGSAFSRAMELRCGDARRAFVSGTASIAPDGRSVRAGDIDGQIDLTLEVIAALLAPRGLGLADTDRAFAYFKEPRDLARFEATLAARGLAGLPFLPMHADVCRDDLLFELELDAGGPAK